ncbi:putative oxidoreductase [Sulfurospirillum diekertiae]|uniref:Oxidoreductase n=1 Tax=Sulfurospirillum diekertiae TaxID=1854492 RepID=A0A290HS33_9BACT|nr:SDR family NAD(P)-dependent oxidoreductase [Sulfurospirillum diekertiae]ATB69454.1 putative oxidoreductase [Sulfurospirillum diekertiae]
MNMNSNTILITGGTSGIGFELARQLCKSNTVIITGRDQEKLDKVKSELKEVHVFQCTIDKHDEIVNLYENVSRMLPDLNILINNAGVMNRIDLQKERDIHKLTEEIMVNVVGTIDMSTQFLPLLRQQKTAAIVNISSALAFVPLASTPVYCASKAALHSFTDSLRIQLKDTNIKVFELAPSVTKTPLIKALDSNEQKGMSIMSVSELVKVAIQKIECDTFEIRPGQSNALKMLSRISPRFALHMINKSGH